MNDVLKHVIDAGRAIVAMALPKEAAEAIDSISKAIEAGHDLLNGDQLADAEKVLADLQASVSAHADDTAAKLRGN